MSVELSFRFLKLNKLQALTMTEEIEGAKYSNDESDNFIGHVPLVEKNFDVINHFFMKHKIGIENCDVMISSGSIDKSEISVPINVNKFLQNIDSKLTISCSE